MIKNLKKVFVLSNMFVFLVIAVCIFGFLNQKNEIKSQANTKKSNDFFKYYTSIEIQPGDTITGIAKKYEIEKYDDLQTFIKEVQEMNHLDGDKISAGAYITVPYYSTEKK